MNARAIKWLAAVGIVAAVVLPVGLSIFLVRQESLKQEEQRALGYAQEVLSRSEETADQVYADFAKLSASPDPDPCSPRNIDLMRKLDLSSEMIQAIGVIKEDRLLCTSLTSVEDPVALGAPDVRQPFDTRIWARAELPFAKGERFLIIARGEYGAIVHRDLPLAVGNVDPKLVVAAVSTFPQRVTLISRGHVKPEWLNAATGKGRKTFSDGTYLVAIVASKRYPIDALAGLPISELNTRTMAIARWVLPFSLLMGGLFAWAVATLVRTQTAMPAVLRAALRRKELFMVYQPVVDLRTGRWVGAEALIRWHRPSGESIRPDVFIVAAEDSGLIRHVTRNVVLEQVRRDAQVLFSEYPDFHIAINLAAEDLQSERTIAMLHELAKTTGARSGSLMVEATERSFADPQTVRSIINALREAGMRVAIDDFGTGYSSLSFLERLNFDLLKIDKSFVETLDTGAATSQVIHHIIEMAKALRLEMIAEGVETSAQAQFLRERGVHYAQGWLFAKAMPFEQLLDALRRERELSDVPWTDMVR